jgi:hypothetical protein
MAGIENARASNIWKDDLQIDPMPVVDTSYITSVPASIPDCQKDIAIALVDRIIGSEQTPNRGGATTLMPSR